MKDRLVASFLGLFRPYHIMAAFGAVAGAVVLLYNLSEAGYRRFARYRLAACFFVSLLIGACASNAANWAIKDLWAYPLPERVARAGFTGYPGLIFATAAFGALAPLIGGKKEPDGQRGTAAAVNAFAPALCLFHAFARMGCAWAGCCYGMDWFFRIGGFELHSVPTAGMEAGFCLLLFIWLESAVTRWRLAVYALGYAGFRFLIEFIRGDDRGALIRGAPGSPAQQIAVCCALLAGGWIIWTQTDEKRKHNEIKDRAGRVRV